MAKAFQAAAVRAGILGVLLCAMSTVHGACNPACVRLDSVVHAAGVPPEIGKAAQRITFEGDKLTADGKKAVAELARQMKPLPAKAVAELKVAADDGAGAAAAKAQAQARRTALATALGQAGLAATRFRISAD